MEKNNEINISSETVICRKSCGVLQKDTDNWGILYNSETDISFAVNPVGIFIWNILEEKISVTTILERVVNYFTNIPGEVEEDIFQFVKKLVEIDLVKAENP